MMVDLYHPYLSGVTHSVDLCRAALEAAGHEVCVFTFGPPAPSDDARVLRSPALPLAIRYGATAVRLGLWHTSEVRERLRAMDVLHVHHPFVSGRLALRYRRGPEQPVVFTSHTRYDLHAEAYLPRGLRGAGRGGLLAMLRGFLRRCDRVLAPTEDMKARLQRWGMQCPIEVVSLGLDLARFQSRATGSRRRLDGDRLPLEARRHRRAGEGTGGSENTRRRRGEGGGRGQYGEGEREVVAVFVGRIGPEKDLPFLLECFAAVAATRPGLRLVIAGDGPQRRALEQRGVALSIADRVCFAGLVPHERIPALLAAADFFVTPSVSEVQPLSVLEALAAGLPVLGRASGGTTGLLQDGVNGFLADDGSSFEAAMAALADDPQRRRRMGAAARAASACFSVTATAARLQACYERVIHSAEQVSSCRC